MLDYHRTLLQDETRLSALKEAIARVVRSGDVVVDLGSGTGILSFFACEAGARRVYAIDWGHLADFASFLARHLRFADCVTVLHEKSTDARIEERADVLITETIGSAGFDENILGYVIDAKKRMLRDDAIIIPRSLALVAVPIDAPALYDKHVGFWSNTRTSFDLSPLRTFASNALYLVDVDDDAYLSEPAQLVDVDLKSVESTLVDGSGAYVVEHDGVVHGFALWFRARLIDNIVLTNREPRRGSWVQTFLPLEEPVRVTRGTNVTLDLQTNDGRSWRWRGTIGETSFDQTTWLSRPPCSKGLTDESDSRARPGDHQLSRDPVR
jgi:ribosomal protein L24E